MQFFNLLANKFLSLTFTWLLGHSVKDSLCGTKVLSKHHYEMIAANRAYFGELDPFGDFDLLFGAAKYNLKIVARSAIANARTAPPTFKGGLMVGCCCAWFCWRCRR
jgi:hypothetical protein